MTEIHNKDMIRLADTLSCTGCLACSNTCKHGAIILSSDKEGFKHPSIDATKCVECGLCVIKCPQINPIANKKGSQKAYAMISNEDRKRSSSGGAFSVFSRYILARNGVVFGASFFQKNENGTLINCFPKLAHVAIESVSDLDVLRGSKYFQSEIGSTYSEARTLLRDGRWVLFTGTPCQIAGLYAYLGKECYDKLITLDIVCHGVPSQGYFDRYIEKLKKSTRLSAGGRNIEGFRFRKLDSWDYRPAVKFAESKWQILSQEDNSFMSSFFKLMTFRECCYNCQYSNMNRVGTFTIADYWGIGKEGLKFSKNVSAGVSLVIDNEDRMPAMMEELRKLAYIEERPLEEGRKYNHNLNAPSKRPKERDTAVADMLDQNISLLEYAKKYHLLDSLVKFFIKSVMKDIVYGLGLYNAYKTISYRFGRSS